MKIFANHAHVFRRDQRADGTVSALLEVMDKTELRNASVSRRFTNGVWTITQTCGWRKS